MVQSKQHPTHGVEEWWTSGGRVIKQEALSHSEVGGKIVAPVLYGESDGVWVHLQHEREKKKEVKVAVMYGVSHIHS